MICDQIKTPYGGRNGFQFTRAIMSPIHDIGRSPLGASSEHLAKAGPVLPVLVRDPASGREAEYCLAMIDTGASISVVDTTIADLLVGARAGVHAAMMSAMGQTTTRELFLELTVPDINERLVTKLIAARIADQGIQILLGRDFLADKVLIYNGKSGQVTICR